MLSTSAGQMCQQHRKWDGTEPHSSQLAAVIQAIQNTPAEGAKQFSGDPEGFRDTLGSRTFQQAAGSSHDFSYLAKDKLSLRSTVCCFL